jgi:hypothetical protein
MGSALSVDAPMVFNAIKTEDPSFRNRKSIRRSFSLFLSAFLSVFCWVRSSWPHLRNTSPLRKMFKRVEKKLAKKREEEELGITEELKEAIGLNDLDSDDSSSDESEASGSSSSPKTVVKAQTVPR